MELGRRGRVEEVAPWSPFTARSGPASSTAGTTAATPGRSPRSESAPARSCAGGRAGVSVHNRDRDQSSPGRRPGDPLLRRRRAERPPRRRRHPGPAAGRDPLAAALGRAARRVGRHRLAPADAHLPAAGRPVPAVPLDGPAAPTEIPDADYQVVVFENRFPSLATGVDRDVPAHAPGAPPAAAAAGLRPVRGRRASPATTTASSPSWRPTAPGWSSTSGPSGPRSCPRDRRGRAGLPASRTTARRSG